MQRSFLALLGAVVLVLGTILPVSAWQEATPTNELAGLGLPVIEVTVTDTAFEGIPEQLDAGRYLVRVTPGGETEFGAGVAFVQPVGVSPEEFLAVAAEPPDESGVGAAPGTAVAALEGTPMAPAGTPTGAESTPGADGDAMALPPFILDAIFAGGAYTFTDQPGEAVIDLPPGTWIAWADDPFAPQEPVIFEVTGEMPSDVPEPAASAVLTMTEYDIILSEGELTAGTQLVRVDNVGAQPHFIFFARGPDGMTEEQVGVVLEEEMAAEMSGTPVAYSDLNPETDIQPVMVSATQSMGTSLWLPLSLEPGSYVLVCFFPDVGDGIPHAYHGMYSVVEVAE